MFDKVGFKVVGRPTGSQTVPTTEASMDRLHKLTEKRKKPQSTKKSTMSTTRGPGHPCHSNQQSQRLALPIEDVANTTFSPPPPDNTHLELAAIELQSNARPPNTRLAYDKRVQEYYAYCDHCYPHDQFRYTLKYEYVYPFFFYQVMRGQRKRGGRKTSAGVVFDADDYDAVMLDNADWYRSKVGLPPTPDNPVGDSTISMYKTVLKNMWKEQKALGNNGRTWHEIWLIHLENLHKWVKKRQPEWNKRNYKEKVDNDFAPYQAAEHFHRIEDEMWRRGHGSIKSGFAWIRHRFCMLFTTSGILRCESLFKAELSDFLGLTLKKETDSHMIYIMIMQMATGKYLRKKNPIYVYFVR